MVKNEILAPVGGKEQLKAAVICGANAVYLGLSSFNARRNAENFTAEDLWEAVKYCHLRGVSVFVTMNTLIFDKELDRLYEAIEKIAESGADAVIVQDFATYKAVRDICPLMPIHASTQMAVHNCAGAKFLERLGFKRIVLARELSLEEMKKIRAAVSTELEVFVHGAHCMSASGNCYLSAMLGERSGNRGLCAQGCRLNWKNLHGREYALSLKDMSYMDSISELSEIGINSFKIEGRMKRPEYVAAAVSSLKTALKGEDYPKDALRSVFSRSGFTDGYLKAQRTTDMFGYRQKSDVISAQPILKDLEALYSEEIHPNPLSCILTLKKDSPAFLELISKDKSITLSGEIPQEPRTAPLSEEIALRSIKKLGDTTFFLENFTLKNPENLTLSMSAINDLRRRGTEALENLLWKKESQINMLRPENLTANHCSNSLDFHIRLSSFSQYSAIFEKAEQIIVPVDEIFKTAPNFPCNKNKITAELPSLIYPEDEEKIADDLKKIKAMGINKGFTGNAGGIELLKNSDFEIHTSHGLNITNSLALNEYFSLGISSATLSFELTQKAISSIGTARKRGAYIYGYLPLMLMRACPQKGQNGCGNCNGSTHLTDRKGIDFPLICHNKKYTVLHNSVPLYIGDKNLSALDFATFYFTFESKAQCEKIFKDHLYGKAFEGKKTNGLFNRELI